MMTVQEQRVLAYIDEHQQELFETVAELVRIDTRNFKMHGNENAGQVFFEKLCRDIGLTVDRYAMASVKGITEHPEYQRDRDAEHRENVVAVFHGQRDTNGVMMAAHIDTMPFGDESAWDKSPLSGSICDGKIYGRGAGDDKYGVVVPWFILKAFGELGVQTTENILIGSYADEEYGGCNGPLALCLKYPCGTYINLDGAGLEKEACGGACYSVTVESYAPTTGVASIFDVFDGVRMIIDELKVLDSRPGTAVRLSSFVGGDGGEKKATVKFAIYTDMSKEQTAEELRCIYEKLQPRLKAEQLGCSEFVRRTRFFAYGKTPEDSREAAILAEAVREIKGVYEEFPAHDLTDLSDFMANGCLNSVNFGMPYGSPEGGGAHQVNEHIDCEELLRCAKIMALFLLRGYAVNNT